MLCIATFIIFLVLFPILGIFSKDYRVLFRKSWQCVIKKVTLQPCDINLGEEIKGKLLGKLIFKYPKFAQFLDKTASFWAGLFVVISIWSLVATMLAGLNLWVYDTCTPDTGESCSLSGEACGVSNNNIDLPTAINQGKIVTWATQPFVTLGNTLSRIPNRLTSWQATDYLAPVPTYATPFDNSKPTAVEFIDPGCSYCKQLYLNIKASGFKDRYNLTYVVYPIPDSKTSTGYKFQASYTISTYLEAMKDYPLENAPIPADWLLLDKIFTENGANGITLQNQFNAIFSKDEITRNLDNYLIQMGYTQGQLQLIKQDAASQKIKDRLNEHKNIVENKVKTIRIPTIIFDGRRYDRVVDAATLRN